MSTEEFLTEAFQGREYQPQILWITPELRSAIETALDRTYPGLRIRYWGNGSRSAWMLEQIGKERLITSGFVTERGQIVAARVLTYRESRGGEIGYASFRNQFLGAHLDEEQKLDEHIDGITGATLSVRSMKRMAVAALVMDRYAQGQASLARN